MLHLFSLNLHQTTIYTVLGFSPPLHIYFRVAFKLKQVFESMQEKRGYAACAERHGSAPPFAGHTTSSSQTDFREIDGSGLLSLNGVRRVARVAGALISMSPPILGIS